MTSDRFCYFENFIFVAITCEQTGLSGSNAVHPLKYPCPISVPLKEPRESVTVEIGRPNLDDFRLLMPHPTQYQSCMKDRWSTRFVTDLCYNIASQKQLQTTPESATKSCMSTFMLSKARKPHKVYKDNADRHKISQVRQMDMRTSTHYLVTAIILPTSLRGCPTVASVETRNLDFIDQWQFVQLLLKNYIEIDCSHPSSHMKCRIKNLIREQNQDWIRFTNQDLTHII